MRLTLPYPPTMNSYWRRNGRRYFISEAGQRFRVDVLAAVLTAFGKPTPMEGELAMTVRLYPPDRRRRDVDNVLKPTLDALQHAGIYADDCQVARLTVERCELRKPGCAEVEINHA